LLQLAGGTLQVRQIIDKARISNIPKVFLDRAIYWVSTKGVLR